MHVSKQKHDFSIICRGRKKSHKKASETTSVKNDPAEALRAAVGLDEE